MNKQKFVEIKSILLSYKADVDNLLKNMINQDAQYKEIYSNSTYENMSASLKDTTKVKFDNLRKAAQQKTEKILIELKSDLRNWTSKEPDLMLLQTLSTIKTMGTKLSYSELQSYMDKSSGNYITMKILSDMAKDSGYYIQFENVEGFEKLLNDVEYQTDFMLKCYCGKNLEGQSMIGDNIVGNANYGKYDPWVLVVADTALKPDSVLERATNKWETAVPLTIEKRKLSEEEKIHIEELYKGHNGAIADRTKELISINPGLKDDLLLHEKYSEFVPA